MFCVYVDLCDPSYSSYYYVHFLDYSSKASTKRNRKEFRPSPVIKATYHKKVKFKRKYKDAIKTFDNTTDRLTTVSWSSYFYPTGVVKPVNGIPTFPLTAKAV